MGSLVLVTGPEAEPVSVAELKTHARIDHKVEDKLLADYIASVRAHVEEIAGIAFLEQTWEWSLDAFPDVTTANPFGAIELPRPPLQSVTSVKYTDVDGNEQTLATSVYAVDTRTLPGRVHLKYSQVWPDTQNAAHAVIVKYVAGFEDVAAIPEDYRQIVRQLTGSVYVHREDGPLSESQMTAFVQRLLLPHRAWVTP